jgi:hypothetical protein
VLRAGQTSGQRISITLRAFTNANTSVLKRPTT